MSLFSRPEAQRGPAILIVILLITLGLAATLAYQAHDAARSHREVAERALRDYASVAAWDYSLNVQDRAYKVLISSFSPVVHGQIDVGGTLPPPEVLAPAVSRAAACETAAEDEVRYYFRLDLRSGALVTSGGRVSEPVRGWIAESVGAHAASLAGPESGWVYAHLYDVIGGRSQSIAYVLLRGEDGRGAVAYGFQNCMGSWGTNIFRDVMEREALLPPALTGGLPNDSLFSVAVTDAHGRLLYASPRQYPYHLAGSFALDDDFGGIVTHVSLSPAAADRLVIGGLPRSRVPFLLALLVLTAGLVAVAVHQLRRHTQLARMRAGFISSVSHELRTPLAQIRMFVETLLLDRVRSEGERRRSLEIIDQESRRLSHLVANVLQFSRAEREASRLSRERLDLAAEARETVEAFGPLATARGVSIEVDASRKVFAQADRFAVRQVLLNLLDNAVKYGPHGQTVTVAVELRGTRARLSVVDQGPGIAPGDARRIWEPFYRRERDVSSAVAGSGIGLAVVRELVLLHGGVAWVERAPGAGCRFVVELPGAYGDVRDTEDAESEAVATAARPGEHETLRA